MSAGTAPRSTSGGSCSDDETVTVTLLYFDGCPNWKTADERLRAALAELGRGDEQVEYLEVVSHSQAEAVGFRGSPTILIDGRDPFGGDITDPVGLSCRLYRSEADMSGAPSTGQMLEALR